MYWRQGCLETLASLFIYCTPSQRCNSPLRSRALGDGLRVLNRQQWRELSLQTSGCVFTWISTLPSFCTGRKLYFAFTYFADTRKFLLVGLGFAHRSLLIVSFTRKMGFYKFWDSVCTVYRHQTWSPPSLIYILLFKCIALLMHVFIFVVGCSLCWMSLRSFNDQLFIVFGIHVYSNGSIFLCVLCLF